MSLPLSNSGINESTSYTKLINLEAIFAAITHSSVSPWESEKEGGGGVPTQGHANEEFMRRDKSWIPLIWW